MVEIRQVLACVERQLSWPVEGAPPACTDPAHEHRQFELHRHLDPVALPDGTTVIATSFDRADPYGRRSAPDFGLYLDQRWQPPWSHDQLDWPDFGVPADPEVMITTLRTLLARARAGERVELGCLGGHGRTGTALAALAVLVGHPAGDAVAWTRAAYCPKAVETPEQEALIADLRPALRG